MSNQLLKFPNGTIILTPPQQLEQIDHVPAAVYRLEVTVSMDGVSIKLQRQRAKYSLPETVYGNHGERVSKVVDRYDRLNPSYGAIAYGLKGSGKTLLFQSICNRMISLGVPVIMVEDPIDAQHLRGVIETIGPCVMFFDEFGKHYRTAEEREKLLTLFGDKNINGVLFLVTANGLDELSDFILNRPGRFHFRFICQEVPAESLLDFFDRHQIDRLKIRWLTGCRMDISFDVLEVMRTPLRESKTYQEFHKAVIDLNVPEPLPVRVVMMKAPTYRNANGEWRPVASYDAHSDGDKLYIEYVEESGSPAKQVSVDLFDSVHGLRFMNGIPARVEGLVVRVAIDPERRAYDTLANNTAVVRAVESANDWTGLLPLHHDDLSRPSEAQATYTDRNQSGAGIQVNLPRRIAEAGLNLG